MSCLPFPKDMITPLYDSFPCKNRFFFFYIQAYSIKKIKKEYLCTVFVFMARSE